MDTTTSTTPTIPADQRRSFGRTKLPVSSLGFGGAPIGNMDTDASVVGRMLETLLDHGVNVVDTAHVYHDSEAVIGAAIAHRRDEYVLISKCGSKWNDDDGLPPAWSPGYIEATIDRSLQRLRTECIDVMLLHSCDLKTLQEGDALGAVVRARDAGKIRFAGYSGDNETAAWAAKRPEIDVIQTSISLCDQRNIDMVLPKTLANDVGVMAKRPVANAAWKSPDRQYEKYRRYAQPYHDRFDAMGLDLGAIQDACGEAIDWPELALRFTLSLPGVHTAIVGSTRVESAGANLAAVSRGPLPDAVVQMVRSANRAADPDGTWPGLT